MIRMSDQMSGHWNQVILFGDSLTQTGFEPSSGCWAALLAHRLQRISDVSTRGFAGYNSRQLRAITPTVFPKEMNTKDVSCVTILIGANDANDVNSPTKQHVPIDEYEDNLVKIIDYLDGIGITKDRIIMMSGPNYSHQRFTEFCRQNGKLEPIKTNQTVGQYANACRSAALRSGVEFIDLFYEFSKQENSDKLFIDGLHFSRSGAQLLYELVWPLVEKRVKLNKQCDELVMNFPDFCTFDRLFPQNS